MTFIRRFMPGGREKIDADRVMSEYRSRRAAEKAAREDCLSKVYRDLETTQEIACRIEVRQGRRLDDSFPNAPNGA